MTKYALPKIRIFYISFYIHIAYISKYVYNLGCRTNILGRDIYEKVWRV